MVTDWIAARDALKARLDAVFAPETFDGLYPGAKAPSVFLGFPVSEPPFYAAVDEVVEASQASGAASMGHAQITFTLHVWLCAQHTELKKAADTLLEYIDAVFGAVLADQRLCSTVDNAFPSIDAIGTGADSSRRYTAAASIAIECARASVCPAPLREVVEAANEELRKELADEGDGD